MFEQERRDKVQCTVNREHPLEDLLLLVVSGQLTSRLNR